MKRLILSIFALFLAGGVSAQEYRTTLINRVDEQTAIVNHNPLATQDQTSFTLTLDQGNRAKVVPGKDITLNGVIKNKTAFDLQVNFRRSYTRLPQGWTSSICFGETCYSPKTDSLPPGLGYLIAQPDSTALFVLHLYVPPSGTPDSLSEYIQFFAENGNPEDTIGISFVGILQSLGVEQQTPPAQTQPKILALYPSPLIDGNSIKVKVNAPREMAFSYSISDELGRSVAFGSTHQRLSQGESTYQISELAGLSTGTYLLKITFGDGSVDTRSFQVAH